ncbi:MAG TPA: FkbM family methyltransferase [Longimicrobiales bacterium]|nr:FkbM family methyltransferase [Longimicrobiales bacterium]
MLAKLLRRAELAYRARRYRRRVDPHEIRWMGAALRPGDLAVDVGAHKGGYLYAMRSAVGATGAVIAFEPQPELASYLSRCVRDFGWSNVTVVERALSSAPGERTLWRPTDAASPAASLEGASLPPAPRALRVETDTLDGALARLQPGRPLRLLKCDVEGHELDVFLGAAETLSAHRPLILVESETRHAPDRSVRDVFEHLERLGYRGSFFWQGERQAVAAFDVERHQIQGRRPYVNSFVFEPSA